MQLMKSPVEDFVGKLLVVIRILSKTLTATARKKLCLNFIVSIWIKITYFSYGIKWLRLERLNQEKFQIG